MPFWNQIILSSSGGGTVTLLSATGNVDGVNLLFSFSQEPSIIVSDGSSLVVNHGWTWSGGVATLQVPPQYYLFGIA